MELKEERWARDAKEALQSRKETMSMPDNARFVTLKPNNTITNDPCAWCGARTDPTGIDFFAGNSWRLVCHECAERVSPDLYRFRTSDDFRQVAEVIMYHPDISGVLERPF